MATALHPLSNYDESSIPNASAFTFGIAVSEWNKHITTPLFEGTYQTLLKHGAKPENIHKINIPGSFELPLAAQWLFEYKNTDAVICLGSVIQGETKHFDFVCQATSQGIKEVSLKYNRPAIFGLLTDNTEQQAIDRSGGKLGNKGVECAIAAIKMAFLHKQFKK
ncbi:MAG: 6,7-dimethyl-8-ribityllumazine synthase [Flavobacteriales bacterium]|nr:6,7-dimethyl-8-ribityllumazine synthase [Flavobacteriales bacterium]